MIDIVKKMSFFASARSMQKAMRDSVNIKYLSTPVKYAFDKNKQYFLYIHIPFCQEFCSFCSFHKFKYNKFTCKNYFESLRKELYKAKEDGFCFHTLYIGGGTPLIDEIELIKTIELAKKLFDIKEVSCESTPNHIQPQILKSFDGLIDRLSIGVQTFDNTLLKEISRYDKYGSSEIIQERLSNIIGILPVTSLDLIFNFPTQNTQMLQNDLHIVKQLNPQQVTTYPLMSSKLSKCSTLEHLKIVNKSKEFEFYNIIRDELKDYTLNNAWSFSNKKTNLSDEYTVSNSEYIGLGSGAFTHINNQLFVNAYDLKQYADMIDKNTNAIVAISEKFSVKKQIQYQFIQHLFGGYIDIQKFNELFNVSLQKILKSELLMLKSIKAISIQDNKIYPTRLGEYLTVIMMREFYVGMDNVRALLRETIMK